MTGKALFLSLALCLPGCALQTAHMAGLRSADGLSAQYPADAQRLADAVADELSRRYAPAQTELALLTVPGQFGVSLEQALRTRGFAVLPEASRGVTVGAVADVIQGELRASGYAEVNTSDGQRFSLLRKLAGDSLLVPAQQEVVAAPYAAPEPSPAVSSIPLNESASATLLAPVAQSAVSTPEKNRREIVLPKAVLTVLPYDWRYTILDTDKRQERVSTPGNTPWRDAIRTMADESGCTASFDEKARRVTLKANANAPRVVASLPTSAPAVAPAVSALHPASLPESPETKSPVVSDALRSAASVPVVPVAQAAQAAPATAAPASDSSEPGASGITNEPAVPAEPPAPPLEAWELDSGSLYACLIRWTDRAGYQLVWKAQDDLTMQASATFVGSFADVTRQLFAGLARSGHSLRVTLYQSNNVMEVRGE